MQRLILVWYSWLSTLAQGPIFRLEAWTDGLEIPALVAALLGIVGALSPCQLTTNLGALAYASGQARQRSPFVLTLAYVAGKVSVYSIAGALVILAGLQIDRASVPVVVMARRIFGPLMIVVGLTFIGVLRFAPVVGQGLALRLGERLRGRGVRGAYLLGVAFSFAFCPTLFWLFFGLAIPLALRSAGGWAFPGVFALGSSLPLLALAGIVSVGLGTADRLVGGVRRVDRPLRIVAGMVLLLAGLHDTLVYWLL